MRRRTTALRTPATALLFAAVLAACGGKGDEPAAGAASADPSLPQPQAAGGSITDMPAQPGPGDVPLAGTAPVQAPELLPADERFGLPPLEDNPETGLASTDAPTPAGDGEPTAADAVGALQAYYAAINARDYARAYVAWSDGGRSSGQTPEQFAAGFADTTRVELVPGTPGPVEGAAGSRYAEIPVTVEATHRDGRRVRYVGHYTLRRAMVDGASAEQRAWHIASADMREAP